MEILLGCLIKGVSLLGCDLKTGLCPWLKLPKPFPDAGTLFQHFLSQPWVSGRTLLASPLNPTNIFPYIILISLEK